ncbi:hypothetical protein MXB_1235 [Myxobolus squamalis]|nr:hypothetical protein MXB_1235 [Myxobolus squamalis]
MSLSSIFILDSQGKKLIYRDYRGDLPIVAVSNKDSNALVALSFLYKLTRVLHEYFGWLEDESVRDNFVLIYEILDEIMDFGYPQLTEPEVLKSYIFESAQKMEIIKAPPAATNAVSWRKEGIKYANNNIYLDVDESVNTLVNSDGIVLNNEINGKILVNSCISGMPEVKIAFNDRLRIKKTTNVCDKYVELEDAKFHQCVRLANFEKDRTISFMPPDGKFELMSYRIQNRNIPPFMVTCSIEGTSDCTKKYFITKVRLHAGTVLYEVIFSSNLGKKKRRITCQCASSEYSFWFWDIFILSENSDDSKPKIRVKFEIVNFVISRFHIQYLKVFEKSGYSAKPWVRYFSSSGVYEFRT